jgi:pre-mRNA-splicing factor 18
MDFLKKEIERKRKELDEANLLNSNKKYFKRGELEQKQTDIFWEKRNALEKQHQTDSDNEKNAAHNHHHHHHSVSFSDHSFNF